MLSRLVIPIALFVLLLAKIDRFFLKTNAGFCLHYIDVPLTANPSLDIDTPFPADLFKAPFTYLGKGAQNFVFESHDHNYVIKFYKFPSHMRRFGWINHPLGYRFSPHRKSIKDHNEKRFHLSYNSYFLAHQYLQQETGVVFVHLNPTSTGKTVRLRDKMGHEYALPLDHLGFVVQKKGEPFLFLLQAALVENQTGTAKKMIDGLMVLIGHRCAQGITDLDNMEHDNYGWADGRALHLDIGRFTFQEQLKTPEGLQKEILRITTPLRELLEKESPELLQYYFSKIRITSSSDV